MNEYEKNHFFYGFVFTVFLNARFLPFGNE